jgi:hypothetical protein
MKTPGVYASLHTDENPQGLYNLNYGVISLTQASMEKDCKICFHKNYPNVTEIWLYESNGLLLEACCK